jgi:hypothetical protein
VHPGHKMSMHYFSFSGGTGTDSTESSPGHIEPNLCFASGRICGSRSALCCVRGAKRLHTIFLLVWDRYGFKNKCVETCYDKILFLHLVGYAGHIVHSSVSGVRNIETLFFMLVWDRYGFHKKDIGTPHAELMLLHPVVSVGHVVHSGASLARNLDALYLMLGWDRCGFYKKHVGTSYIHLVFLLPVGYAGHVVYSLASRA